MLFTKCGGWVKYPTPAPTTRHNEKTVFHSWSRGRWTSYRCLTSYRLPLTVSMWTDTRSIRVDAHAQKGGSIGVLTRGGAGMNSF